MMLTSCTIVLGAAEGRRAFEHNASTCFVVVDGVALGAKTGGRDFEAMKTACLLFDVNVTLGEVGRCDYECQTETQLNYISPTQI